MKFLRPDDSAQQKIKNCINGVCSAHCGSGPTTECMQCLRSNDCDASCF